MQKPCELVAIVERAITICAHDDINEEVSLTNKFFVSELMMQFKAANNNSHSEFLIELYTSYNTDKQIIYDCITYCKCFLPNGQTQFPIFQTVNGAKAVYNAIQAPNRKVIANLNDPDFLEFVAKYIRK